MRRGSPRGACALPRVPPTLSEARSGCGCGCPPCSCGCSCPPPVGRSAEAAPLSSPDEGASAPSLLGDEPEPRPAPASAPHSSAAAVVMSRSAAASVSSRSGLAGVSPVGPSSERLDLPSARFDGEPSISARPADKAAQRALEHAQCALKHVLRKLFAGAVLGNRVTFFSHISRQGKISPHPTLNLVYCHI